MCLTSALAFSDVIHFESPVCAAIFPSSVVAVLRATKVRCSVIFVMKISFNFFASFSRIPSRTSIPAFLSFAIPFPATIGLTSRIAITTFLIPYSIIKSAHGGVLP